VRLTEEAKEKTAFTCRMMNDILREYVLNVLQVNAVFSFASSVRRTCGDLPVSAAQVKST